MSEMPPSPPTRSLDDRIRELEQTNAETRARLAELQALFDAAPIGIFVGRDADCRRMVMNPAGARMLRLAPEINPSKSGPDAPALPFRVFHAGRELAPEELPMQLAARHGIPVEGFEEELRFDDGAVRYLMTYAAPLRDEAGAVRGCVGTFADITEAKRVERLHQETLERLQLHLDNNPVATVEWDDRGRVLRWSPAAERIFGWRESEALGRTEQDLGLVHEADREAVDRVLQDLLQGRVARNASRNRNRRKNGAVVHCEWHNSVLRDARGGLLSVLSIAMDVTDRHMLENSLRNQAECLEEADRRKDDFLSMLGHELRNPLTPIRNAVRLLRSQPDDPRTADWAQRVIDRQTGHLERLVDDLLDVARIVRGSIRLERRPLDLAAVVRETAEATLPLAQQRGQRLHLDLPGAPVPVAGDATRLAQVLANLLGNAVKYTHHGGQIQVSLGQADGLAELAVADDGRGIAAADLPHIFDAFGQGDQGLGRAEAGLGLGLTLVRRLTEMHGGRVEADSAGADLGSRFVVYLPLCPDPLPAPDRAPDRAPARPPAARKRRVLVVDDNADIADSLVMLLGLYGFDVSSVPTGTAALGAVAHSAPDVVLLDIGLPDIDGIEVARRLGALPARAAMKVVAVSGYGERVTESRGEPALFDAHLLKPPALDSLLQVLD